MGFQNYPPICLHCDPILLISDRCLHNSRASAIFVIQLLSICFHAGRIQVYQMHKANHLEDPIHAAPQRPPRVNCEFGGPAVYQLGLVSHRSSDSLDLLITVRKQSLFCVSGKMHVPCFRYLQLINVLESSWTF